jgi:hypothetical protein
MKISRKTQNVIFDFSFDESTIRKTYEDIFENPCRFYFELKKAFITVSELMTSDLIDSFNFQS